MKKSNLKTILVLMVISFLIVAANYEGNLNRDQPFNRENVGNKVFFPQTAANHGPIDIDGNAELATFVANEGLDGDGTYEFPYILENFVIDVSSTYGIEIRNTNAYLIIRDCTVIGDNASFNYGIYLKNALNVNISNNELSLLYFGIYLSDSSNNTLSGNNASENPHYGIYLTSSSNNTLSGNTANYCGTYGIMLYSLSNNNTVSGNTATNNANYGIFLYTSSNNNTLSANYASDNGFSGISLSSTSSYNILSGNTVYENFYFGISLSYSSNNTLSGNFIHDSGMIGISLYYSNNNTLSSNLMYDSGVDLIESYENFIDVSNKLNDKSVIYHENISEIHLSGDPDVGQVILLNCNDSIIEDLQFSGSTFCLNILESSNCLISENLFTGCTRGINLLDSSNITLSGNFMDGPEVGRYEPKIGFTLDSSSNITFSGNMMEGLGLMLVDSYENDIDITNKVNGKSVRYYENTPGVQFSGESDVGQVILINCSDSVLEGLTIVDTYTGITIQDSLNCSISETTVSGCYHGIFIDSTNDTILSKNNIFTNRFGISSSDSRDNSFSGNSAYDNEEGIHLAFSDDNTLSENLVYNNNYGMYLAFSSNNTLSGNNASYNTDHGISLLYAPNNTIFFNDIYENQNAQAYEGPLSSGNQWDNGTTGNYWGDDYISIYPVATNDGIVWDTPFEIDGDYDELDHFPLVNSIHLESDAPQFTMVQSDWSANEGYSGLIISWTATDVHPDTYTIELDGTEVVSATEWTSGTAISYDIPEGLALGEYNITIFVSDESGNMAQNTVILTIEEHDTTTDSSTDTTTSDEPTDPETGGGIPGYPLVIFLVGGMMSLLGILRSLKGKNGNN